MLGDILPDFRGEFLVYAQFRRLRVKLLHATAADHVAIEARGDVRRHQVLKRVQPQQLSQVAVLLQTVFLVITENMQKEN